VGKDRVRTPNNESATQRDQSSEEVSYSPTQPCHLCSTRRVFELKITGPSPGALIHFILGMPSLGIFDLMIGDCWVLFSYFCQYLMAGRTPRVIPFVRSFDRSFLPRLAAVQRLDGRAKPLLS